MTTMRTTNTKKLFKTLVNGEEEISQVTPALLPDQFQTTEAYSKDRLLKVPCKNFGTKLDLRSQNGNKAKTLVRKQMNKEMVNSCCEKFKPRVLMQVQVDRIHGDLRFAFNIIFQVKLIKES